jgi:GTPase Era involved in 16S rRNA processing
MKSIEKNENKCKAEDRIKADLLARKELMEKARRELPYTFEGKTDAADTLRWLVINTVISIQTSSRSFIVCVSG